jgi:hypothetical protein
MASRNNQKRLDQRHSRIEGTACDAGPVYVIRFNLDMNKN